MHDTAAVYGTADLPLAAETASFDLFIYQSETELRKYEPKNGVYLGAYIKSDRALGGSIADFERKMDAPHALYAHRMEAGGDFPFRWILELAATMKTPLITVVPADNFAPFDLEPIKQTAADAGRFNLPIFINLYPFSRELGYNAAEYTDFFRKASAIFAETAPNAAIIWSVHYESVFGCEPFYPGADYVDWVGIAVFSDIRHGEHECIMRHINHLYLRFQREHPIIITGLGVSYYTTENFTFHTRQAAAVIERVYDSISTSFPRIKAVVYSSFDNTDFNTGRRLNNYRITGEPPLIEAYSRAVSGERFLSLVDENTDARHGVTVKSPFRITEKNGTLFLPRNALTFDLETVDANLFANAEMPINGETHYSFRLFIIHTSLKHHIDYRLRVITIYL
jgi:hypothetical protein